MLLLAGWQLHIVRERDLAIEQIRECTTQNLGDAGSWLWLVGDGNDSWQVNTRRGAPWIWRLLGAQLVTQIHLNPKDFSHADAERLADLFPEAEIWRPTDDAKAEGIGFYRAPPN